MERQYYGRPEYDSPSGHAGEDIRLSRELSHILYDLGDSGLRRVGLNPRQVNGWTKDLSNGIIPIGASVYEFEETVLQLVGTRRTRG